MPATYPLQLGCTKARARDLGIIAIVNARGGRQDLNDLTQEQIELERDARAIRDKLTRRVRWYGPTSKFFRRHRARIAHLIDSRGD